VDDDPLVWEPKDATYICEVPKELGRVTKLSVRNGKVVAETASGTQMIVPQPRQK